MSCIFKFHIPKNLSPLSTNLACAFHSAIFDLEDIYVTENM